MKHSLLVTTKEDGILSALSLLDPELLSDFIYLSVETLNEEYSVDELTELFNYFEKKHKVPLETLYGFFDAIDLRIKVGEHLLQKEKFNEI